MTGWIGIVLYVGQVYRAGFIVGNACCHTSLPIVLAGPGKDMRPCTLSSSKTTITRNSNQFYNPTRMQGWVDLTKIQTSVLLLRLSYSWPFLANPGHYGKYFKVKYWFLLNTSNSVSEEVTSNLLSIYRINSHRGYPQSQGHVLIPLFVLLQLTPITIIYLTNPSSKRRLWRL